MSLSNEQRKMEINKKLDERRVHGVALRILRKKLPGDICEKDQEELMKTIEFLEEASIPGKTLVDEEYLRGLVSKQGEILDGYKELKKALKVILTLEV